MIENLNLKLSGLEPVTRKDLFKLINSWGRIGNVEINDFYILECEAKEKYPLENLDVSQIEDLSYIFSKSLFNGDISNWNVSNCRNMEWLFYESKFDGDLSNWNVSNVENLFCLFYLNNSFNNDSIKNWDVSNVNNFCGTFDNSIFNQNISKWDVSNGENFSEMFYNSQFDGDISSWDFGKASSILNIINKNNSFMDKYDILDIQISEKNLFLKWLEENRYKMRELNQESKEEVLDFFSFKKNQISQCDI